MAKSADAFRTISEVSDWLETPAHVLRFWESKFAQVKPVKRAGGRRYYRPNDMLLLGGLKKLLHEDGLSIKDAQKYVRDNGVKQVASLSRELDKEEPEKPTTPTKDVRESLSIVTDAPTAEVTQLRPTKSLKASPTSGDQADLFSTLEPDPMYFDQPVSEEPEEDQHQVAGFNDTIFPKPEEQTVMQSIAARGAEMDPSTLRSYFERLSALRDRMAAAEDANNGS